MVLFSAVRRPRRGAPQKPAWMAWVLILAAAVALGLIFHLKSRASHLTARTVPEGVE